MQNTALSLLLSRLDFAWITSMHILYPPLTVGLSILLFFAEWRWVRTNDEQWYRLTRFFEKLFIINFGAGVATGITMEMAFGILYGPFSQAAGPFFGQVLGYETITAFMYEAGFVGLMVFGWGKIGKKMHLFATANVAVASTLSAMWILVANSWMQTPTGVVFKNGFFQVVNWGAATLQPGCDLRFPAYGSGNDRTRSLLRRRGLGLADPEEAACARCSSAALKYSVLALVVIAPLQVYLGDGLGQIVARDQPAALAALEGHYHTYNPDGSVNTGWDVVAWPNASGRWHCLGDYHSARAEPAGDPYAGMARSKAWIDIPPQDRPPMLIPFYSFRIMAGAGAALMLLAFWGLWLALRGKMTRAQHRRQQMVPAFHDPLRLPALYRGLDRLVDA